MDKSQGTPFKRIEEYIDRTLQTSRIPGLAIGITDRKRTIWTRAFGYEELESKRRVRPTTLFEIGSISKFFSSTVLMQLRDEGKVDLNKPVTEYLPWFKVRTRYGPITLHHLLTHTAGLVIGQEESPEGMPAVWMLRETETGSAPGTHFYYSNEGYKTVGLVMERLTGTPVGQLVRSRVLAPLGMNSTDPVITNETRSRLAVGYEPFYNDRPYAPGMRLAPGTWFESGTADGTICSTPKDMCCYLRMLLNGGRGPRGRLVSEEGFALMTAPHIKPEDNYHGESYGYGMNVGRLEGHSCLWHTGGMVGFHASIVADLDAGLGVVTLVNGPGAPETVSFFALKTLLAHSEGRKLPKIDVERVKSVDNPAQYAGTYRSRSGKVGLIASGNALWLKSGRARTRLEPAGPDRFYSSAKGFDRFLLSFGRDGEKVVEVFYGEDWYTKSNYRGPKRFLERPSWSSYRGHYRANNPWTPSFRIVLRKGKLVLIDAYGSEDPMTPEGNKQFRIGADPMSPERIRFEMFIDGIPHMAVRSAGRFYRSFVP